MITCWIVISGERSGTDHEENSKRVTEPGARVGKIAIEYISP